MKPINLKTAMDAYREMETAHKYEALARKKLEMKNISQIDLTRWELDLTHWKEECTTRGAAWLQSADKLSSALADVQKRCTARTISAETICETLLSVEQKLGISKAAMNGVIVYLDYPAQTFPSAYKYCPESTQFTAHYVNRHWVLDDICRGQTHSPQTAVRIHLTDAAKTAILDRFAQFSTFDLTR